MDSIERAIRNAFQKGDADDRAFRERVYRSALAALDRALQANPHLPADDVAERKQRFKAKIIEIEREFVPAIEEPAAQADGAPEPVAYFGVQSREPASASAPAPDLGGAGIRDRVEPGFEPNADRPAWPDQEAGADNHLDDMRNERRIHAPELTARRGRTGLLVSLLVLIAAAGISGWWYVQSVILTPGGNEASTTQPAPAGTAPASGQAQQPAPSLGAVENREWITVFEAPGLERVDAPAGTNAELAEFESRDVLRISANGEGGVIGFDVGEGTLERLAGHTVVFSITARSEDGSDTQISVSCDFGALGDCGRRRYIMGFEQGEYLFEAELPSSQPNGSGRILIAPDLSNAGNTVDVSAIRAAIAE